MRRAQIVRLLLSAAVSVLVVAGMLAIPASAFAIDDEPLRLVFINSDPSDGSGAYDAVEAVLEASDDLVLTDAEDLLDAASDHGISLEAFRSGDKRASHKETFEAILQQVDAEAIVVLDVFGSGRTMQFVIIGPFGDELKDVRQKISGGRPNQSEVIQGLRQAFKQLVPEVRSYREWKKEQQQKSADVDLLDEEDDRELTVKERVVEEHRQNHANLTPGFKPSAGMIFGRRSMILETDANYSLDHASPFVGAGVEIDGIFALLDGHRAAFGATAFGAYAPFSTVFTDQNNEDITYASSFSNVGADLKYLQGMGPELILQGKAGAELMTIAIASNDAYTGHSYMNLRAGAGVIYRVGELAELHLDAALLPTVDTEMSGEAMGPAQFSLGYSGAGRLYLTLFEPIDVSLGYDFHYYSVDFLSPELADLDGQAAATTDMFHLASLMVGYGF